MAASLSVAPAGTATEWEQTNCLLCGSPRWSTLLEAPDPETPAAGPRFTVAQCRECGLCFTNPRPGPTSMGHFYRTGYRPHLLGKAARLSRRRRDGWLGPVGAFDGRRLEKGELAPQRGGRVCADAIPPTAGRRLLDFGCGSGRFLRRMRERGWQVLGLDCSEAVVCRVRSQLGLRALVGTLPHPGLSPEGFDVITMWQSLEHVHRPLEVLQHAHRLLVPGGQLIAAVPNIDSAPFRWFGPAWFGLDLPRHLTHFSAVTLPAMLERAGFRVASVRMVRHTTWLQRSARLAARQRWGPHRLHWLRTRPLCRLASLYCLLSGQSDCILATAVKPTPGS